MEARKKRIGDRKEGRKLRSLDAYYGLTPFIMQRRSDSVNYFPDRVEITEADRFLRKRRIAGERNLSFLHLFIAAFVRTTSQMPALNRFIAGQRIYARKNIEMVMSIKKEMSVKGGETSIKVVFEPTDTLEIVYKKINEQIELARGADTGTDKTANALMKVPRLILKFCIFLLRILDYFGWLPQSLLDVSPFHGSVIITDLGSLGIPPVYHHIYDFGTLPIFIAFGGKYREHEINKKGEVVEKKYIDYKVATDERICDGYYFAKAFKLMKAYLRDPEKLDVPPETVVEDVD